MKIYSMTATFGKLNHQTLTLQPGLNIVEAPNEWGKSTWCAFLVAMLYGINTREQTKTGFLADKEHYMPWSGAPMSGRMDLCWQGRDITIERRNKGRGYFNDFKAYETESGLAVEELTAANCGQLLLGVEQSVFIRAGFLRQSELAVSPDEKLRARLNALVTTGDESGADQLLAQKLKELKNRCRFNRTGLIPQAEQQLQGLQQELDRLDSLHQQETAIAQQLADSTGRLEALQNHQQALAYAQYERSRELEVRAQEEQAAAREAAQQLAAQCEQLLPQSQLERQLQQLDRLQQELEAQALAVDRLTPEGEPPVAPEPFAGLTGEQAVTKAKQDQAAYDMLCKLPVPTLLVLAGICLVGGLVGLLAHWAVTVGGVLLASVFLSVWLKNRKAQKRDRHFLCLPYRPVEPAQWEELARQYQRQWDAYEGEKARCAARREALARQEAALQAKRELLCPGQNPVQRMGQLQAEIALWGTCRQAQIRLNQAETYLQQLRSVARPAQAPAGPDTLTLTPEQTDLELSRELVRQQRLAEQRSDLRGQIKTRGNRAELEAQRTRLQERLAKLERFYGAVVYAMEQQQAASQELQRRFAPRIAQKAQSLLGRLTDGRYDRLVLDRELQISAAAQDEDTLRDNLWRSSGTADQLYLALRLAVAQELAPDAPLVLDDALVRFDDTRMARTLELLQEESREKQILLFTCQSRERLWENKVR